MGIFRRATVILGVVGVLLVGACGDDDRADEERDGASHRSTEESSATEPPGSDPEAVQRYVVELVAQHDHVVNEIVADPSVALDREDPLVEDYLGLYEPGSQFADAVLMSWVGMHSVGQHVRPYDPTFPINQTRLDGEIETVDDDEVRFLTCEEVRRQVVGVDGEVVEELPFEAHRGEGQAVRVDGKWRLRRFDTYSPAQSCEA